MSNPIEQQRVSSICSECGAPVEFELGTQQVQCEHCDAGLAVAAGQRLLRLSCPSCSGNFYYLDGAMGGRCPFCHAQLLAISRDRILRYVISPGPVCPPQAEGASLHLLPFWHLAGLIYGFDIGSRVTVEQDPQRDAGGGDYDDMSLPSTVRKESGPMKAFRGRVIDLSLPDPATRAFGVNSLRWRAVVFPMEPFAAHHEQLGRVVPPTIGAETVRDELYNRAFRLRSPTEGMTQLDCQRQDLVSEELALFYYPFWVREVPGSTPQVWDGVTGESEATAMIGHESPRPSGTSVFDDLRIVELKCRACGESLIMGNHSVVLPCSSCGQFWLVTRDGLQPFQAHYAKVVGCEDGGAPGGGKALWLPFWRVPVTVRFRGKAASKVLDLVNALGVMRSGVSCEPAPPDSPLHYFAPAYGALRAPRVDHAARDMTRGQPRLEAGDVGRGEICHCFFGPDDAHALSYVTWMQVLPSSIGSQLRSLRLRTSEPSLWYIPFEDRGHELANILTGNRYEPSSFRGVRH